MARAVTEHLQCDVKLLSTHGYLRQGQTPVHIVPRFSVEIVLGWFLFSHGRTREGRAQGSLPAYYD